MNATLHLDLKALPLSLVPQRPLSDEKFEALCLANDLLRLERTREGEVLVQAPAGGFTSSGNSEIIRQLRNWWMQHRCGFVFDSNCGFFLRDGSMLAPDAAYATPERTKHLSKEELTKMPRFCPDFVIELLSPSDRPNSPRPRWSAGSKTVSPSAGLSTPIRKESSSTDLASS